MQPSRKPIAADIKNFAAIPPILSSLMPSRRRAQYYIREMVPSYLKVQSLLASSLLVASSVHSHAHAVLHTHVITC